MKREKFSIWGSEPQYKKACYELFHQHKASWPIGHILKNDDEKYMKEMMGNFYYSPLKPNMVQDIWHKNKDKIIEIKVVSGPIFREKTFEFWTEKPTFSKQRAYDVVDGKVIGIESPHYAILEDIGSGKMFNFSVARCICFPGQTGLVHESAKPKSAVMEALKNAIAQPKIEWKKSKGYRSGIDPQMDAHHVDGKEFKTLVLKFIIDALKISEEDFYNKIYPEHGNFETSFIEYVQTTGWQFKNNPTANKWRNSWFDFHEKYREYEMVDPNIHREITSNETKFKTSIRDTLGDLLK
jgi:hypothetical protein